MKLQLDALYPLFCDAETTAWNCGDALPPQDSTQHENDLPKDTVGSQILSHGKTIQNIHAYFMNFEQRRCCINLVAGKTTLTNVRIIPVAREDCDDEYSESRSHCPSQLRRDKLTHQEFHLYCETILCALFPILGAPTPPHEHSPPDSPEDMITSTGAAQNKGEILGGATADNEEFSTSLVKDEQIVELVRNVFGISQERAAQYDTMIFNLHARQKPAKILAEELVRQLSQLENDCVPFYEADQFLNSRGYREWLQIERQRLTEMITKFWHGPLPNLKSGRLGPHLANQNGHKHYTRLMTKLIQYTRKLFPPSELYPTFLTTDAQRLLKEFGLRYGVGDQYRRLVYLEYVAMNFLQELWYVHHANGALCEILRALPVTPSRLIMVAEEKKILEKCCQCFLLECENSLRKVRLIFPGFSPHVSIGLLLELLRNTLKISSFLSGEPHPPVKLLLESWLENGFTTEYEQHKLMECYDLKLDPSRSLLSPRLLYRIIIKIRDSVRSYRNEYQSIFKSYFEIHKMAALCFYKLLMSDVRVMCEDAQLSHDDNELSLQMVSFAFRLNQLDRDWAQYVTKQNQTWRKSYLPEALHWVNVVQRHSTSLVLQSIASDKFSFLDIEEREVLTGMMSFCPKFPKSLSPSQMSAFSETFHLVSQDSYLTIPSSGKARLPRSRRAYSSDTLQRQEPVKRRILNSAPTDWSSNDQIGVMLSVPDITARPRSPCTVKNEIDCHGNVRRFSLSTVKEQQTSTSLSKSMSSPEIHALMQRYEDIQKIQDQSLLRSIDDVSAKNAKFRKDLGFGRFGSLPSVHNSDFQSEDLLSDRRTYLVDPETLDAESSEYDLMKTSEENADLAGQTFESVQGQVEDKADCARYDDPFMAHDIQDKTKQVLNEVQVEVQIEVYHQRNTFEASPIHKPEPLFPPLQQVSHNMPRRNLESARSSGINSMVIAAHRALNESNVSEIPKLSRQSSNLSDIFKEVRVKACTSGWSSPDVRYGLPLTSSPLSVGTSGTAFEVISGKLMVSSSVIDLVCLLNRMANFFKTISDVVYPLQFGDDTQGKVQATGDFNASTELRDLSEQIAIGRKLLLDKLKRMVFVCMSVYSQNMLAMDMCSLTDEVGRQLAGTKLLEDLRAGHECGHIWGCRHSANGHSNPNESDACYTYTNVNPRYLASKYEPIDSKMCLRINNMCEVIDVLDHIEIQFDQYLSSEELNNGLEELNLLGAEAGEDEASSRKDRTTNEGVSDNSDFFRRSKLVLQATRNALLNILAYRINLFAKDALAVLLSLQLPLVSMQGRLAPLSEFLSRHLDVLNKWLVHDAYMKAAEQLWELIVHDFEDEEKKIVGLKEYAPHYAKLLLQAIAHLIKMYSTSEPELSMAAMSNLTAKVTFRLEVHALTTKRLINLARALHNMQLRQFHESLISHDIFTPLNEILKNLRSCLHASRKSFTGQELLNWLLSNPQFFTLSVVSELEIFGNITPLTENSEIGQSGNPELKRRAVTFCQQLIDSNIICPLLEEKMSAKLENSVNLVEKVGAKLNPYPNVMECISVGSSNISGLMGVQSVVSGRGYDTDEETGSEDADASSDKRCSATEVRATVHSKRERSLTSNSLKIEKQTMEAITEGQEASSLLKTNVLGSLSTPDLQKSLGLTSTNLDSVEGKKTPVEASDAMDNSDHHKSTGASETTSNSSAYIFQNTRFHYYYLHSLAAVFDDRYPNVIEQGSFIDLYLENGVNFDFVMDVLQARRKYDSQAREFVKTFFK